MANDSPMQRKAVTLCLLLSSLLLVSCHRVLVIYFTNNTAHDVTVVSLDTRLAEHPVAVPNGRTVQAQVPYKLKIRHTGGTWSYDPLPVPETFDKRVRPNTYREDFQIEKDGSICVVLPGGNEPVAVFPPQPPGYPLRPK
jgi:hypothetical protein